MTRKSLLIASLATLLATGGAAGVWWWQKSGREQAVSFAALPRVPDLSGAHPLLREKILEADTQARTRTGAKAGLAQLTRLYHANGFLEEAMHGYAGLEQLDPADPHIRHRHASILAGFGELDPAMNLWRQVIALAPDYEPARLRLADCLLKSNRHDEAAAVYSDVLKRNPDSPYAKLGLARIDYEAQRWDQARERLEAIVRQTNFELGYDLIVSLYERLGQHDRAEAIRGAVKASGAYRDPPDPWLDDLLEVCFDPYRLSVAAGTMVRDASARALQLLNRAIELSPQDVSMHFQLASMSQELGDVETARQQFERCTQMAPDLADGWARLAALYLRIGDAAAALRTIEAGLQACPLSPSLHLMRARELERTGRTGEAAAEYRTSIRLRPNEPDAYLGLGNLLIRLNRTEEGIAQIRAALNAEPGNPMALGILTFYAITTGQEADARQWLARVRRQPRVPASQVDKLLSAYRSQFGRDWSP